MFVRKWSGLPADPQFPSNIKDLGYFVNEDDEVRSIEDPDYYFKFFINRNERWNERQRFAMHQAVQAIIFERLEALGMQKTILPLGHTDLTTPHVPIFMSKDIDKASRVVVVIGETHQDLGVLAWRVATGPGGIFKGSMAFVVKELQKQQSSPTDANPPGIILANTGELTWWDGGKRTVNRIAFEGQPMASACRHNAYINFSGEFHVPGNKTAKAHIEYIFEKIISDTKLIRADAKIDFLAIGDGADVMTTVLDSMWPGPERLWDKRINCFANVGGMLPDWFVDNKDFLEGFMRERTRVWTLSTEPTDTVLSTYAGNEDTNAFTQFGSYVFSAGADALYTETMIIHCHRSVLSFMQDVALFVPFTITTMGTGEDGKTESKEVEAVRYKNPEFFTAFRDAAQEPDTWTGWVEDQESNVPDSTDTAADAQEIPADRKHTATNAFTSGEVAVEPDAEAELATEMEKCSVEEMATSKEKGNEKDKLGEGDDIPRLDGCQRDLAEIAGKVKGKGKEIEGGDEVKENGCDVEGKAHDADEGDDVVAGDKKGDEDMGKGVIVA
ncbi:Arb2 domain-containing protein [Xylariaceae sp. FL1019]|nr:Arb2 domain-containing protein [Xylariaceae sp. FL1019]